MLAYYILATVRELIGVLKCLKGTSNKLKIYQD